MPRDLPLGNGDFLVTFDGRYQLRDIFYPNVGLENHTVGDPSRFGIWIDGEFAWSGDDGWERRIAYEHETLVGDTTLTHARLGVVLHLRDAVDFDRNLYLKEVTVEDTSGRDREARLFQHFDAHLYGNDTGDSAYYDPRCQALVHYKRSTLVIRTQVDNRGAIIAANDSDVLRFNRDTYSYLWPRDGALVADSLDLAGYGEVTRRFFFLCGDLMTREGYLLHKYNPDGSLGSSWHAWSTPDGRLELPIQEDETGLPIWALWQHYERDRDIEFIRPLYRKLVRTGADFMATYREPRTKLPAPSFDLWEERRGIHAFTTAAVWAGLTAARNFAVAFGQHELAKRYAVAAQEIRDAALVHLWDADRGRFVRTINVLPDGTVVKDATIDISLAGIFLFGLLPASDDRIRSTMRAIEDRLSVRTPVGGTARYENDYYLQLSSDIATVPGNPWFVATLWLAEHLIAIAEKPADLDRPRG